MSRRGHPLAPTRLEVIFRMADVLRAFCPVDVVECVGKAVRRFECDEVVERTSSPAGLPASRELRLPRRSHCPQSHPLEAPIPRCR